MNIKKHYLIWLIYSTALYIGAQSHHPKSIPALRERTYQAQDLKIFNILPVKDNLYAAEFSYVSDGNLNYGLIERPAGKPPKTGWPVIILAHGHIPPKQYSTTRNYRLVTRYYATGGFMVVKPDYRGHGRSEGDEERSLTYTVDYSIDLLNLLAGIDKLPGADKNNIFLYGHSMGGEIALRILTIDKTIKGASLWAAVTKDFPENTLYYRRRRNLKQAQETARQIERVIGRVNYKSIAPSTYFDSIQAPLIIHHGTADKSVPFEWSGQFLENLNKADISYTFHKYPGENHNISRSFYKVMDADMLFFRGLIDN